MALEFTRNWLQIDWGVLKCRMSNQTQWSLCGYRTTRKFVRPFWHRSTVWRTDWHDYHTTYRACTYRQGLICEIFGARVGCRGRRLRRQTTTLVALSGHFTARVAISSVGVKPRRRWRQIEPCIHVQKTFGDYICLEHVYRP